MANSFLEFIPIIALMGRLFCNNLFKFKKRSQKPLKSEITLKMSFFAIFIKNDHFLAEFLKKRVFYSLLLIETTQSSILRQFKIK